MLKDDQGVSISFLCVNDQVLKLKAHKKIVSNHQIAFMS